MEQGLQRRSDRFLMQYRVLEGLLEKRYADRKTASGSVVMEYLHDADSTPYRAGLDLCREIRNLLSHNVDQSGMPVVEPSEDTLGLLDEIVEYVRRPRLARDYGTPGDRITFAHPNDSALDVIRHMQRMGYSHVPVRTRDGLVGVFSAAGLMRFVDEVGFDRLSDDVHVGDLKNALDISRERNEKYLFMNKDATLTAVRAAFEAPHERNSRLSVVFITEDGTPRSDVLAMLTPWDVLKSGD